MNSIPSRNNEKQESEKKNSETRKNLWTDDPDYASGFVETRKRVARTPPETLMRRVGHKPIICGSSNVINLKESDETNPRRDTNEEIKN